MSLADLIRRFREELDRLADALQPRPTPVPVPVPVRRPRRR
jgi:hypothetical protein